MKFIRAIVCLVLVLTVMLLAVPVTAWAQGRLAGNDERTYGTASATVFPISAASFVRNDPSLVGQTVRFCADADEVCGGEAGVALPAGAVVTSIEIDGCLAAAPGVFIRLTLDRLDADGISWQLAHSDTRELDIVPPACTRFPRGLLDPPETIDNRNNFYSVRLEILSGGNSGTLFRGVRIFYQLQVSPAPAVATFNDVPTNHPFFPFIEALVAAGITTGCSTSPPLFCPDGPVTRKQMAAFLGKALGLHWAP